jgi:integrase
MMNQTAPVIEFKPQSKPKRLRGERVSFSPEQLKAFLHAAQEFGAREFAMFMFAFSHGARVSEIADLCLSDLFLDRNQVQIRRLKGSVGTLQSLVKINGFDEREAIEAYLKVRPEVGTDILFVSCKSTQVREGAAPYQMNRSQVFRLFGIICEKAGIEKRFAHPHTLKHSLGQILYDSGVDLSMIQSRLGLLNTRSQPKINHMPACRKHCPNFSKTLL